MDRQRRAENLLFWSGLVFVGTAYEVWALRTDKDARTLSAYTRRVFRTDTRLGRAAFTLAWGGLAAWFGHHILTIEGDHHE